MYFRGWCTNYRDFEMFITLFRGHPETTWPARGAGEGSQPKNHERPREGGGGSPKGHAAKIIELS